MDDNKMNGVVFTPSDLGGFIAEGIIKNLDQLKKAIDEYIHYFNNERITVKLKGLTPIQYRRQSSN